MELIRKHSDKIAAAAQLVLCVAAVFAAVRHDISSRQKVLYREQRTELKHRRKLDKLEYKKKLKRKQIEVKLAKKSYRLKKKKLGRRSVSGRGKR